MAKRMTVLDFATQIGAASDPIPVKIKRGADTIGEAKSLYWIASHGTLGILESKITFATLKRDEIIVQVK